MASPPPQGRHRKLYQLRALWLSGGGGWRGQEWRCRPCGRSHRHGNRQHRPVHRRSAAVLLRRRRHRGRRSSHQNHPPSAPRRAQSPDPPGPAVGARDLLLMQLLESAARSRQRPISLLLHRLQARPRAPWTRGGGSHGWETHACASSTPPRTTASTGSSRPWASSMKAATTPTSCSVPRNTARCTTSASSTIRWSMTRNGASRPVHPYRAGRRQRIAVHRARGLLRGRHPPHPLRRGTGVRPPGPGSAATSPSWRSIRTLRPTSRPRAIPSIGRSPGAPTCGRSAAAGRAWAASPASTPRWGPPPARANAASS